MKLRSLHTLFIPLVALLAVLSAAPLSAQSASHSLTREQAVASLTAQLVDHFNLEGELQLELLRPWTDPAPAAAPISLAISEYPARLSSSILLRARIESAGASLGEVTLLLRAQLIRDAWVARQPANRGDLLDPSSMEIRRVDVLRERDVLPATSLNGNLSFARSISAGRIVPWRDVPRRTLVRKGDIIEVAATDGPLSVTMKALAMQNGAAGDIVTVRNLESKKDISAQVVAEKRVQVRF